MRTLYLLNIHGNRYGVWKDEVGSLREVRTVHRIPLSPACIAGISVLDGRSTALADLGVCIGLQPVDASRGGSVLLAQGKDSDPGFVVSGAPEEKEIAPDEVLPLPAYVRTAEISTCVVLNGLPVPVIGLARLYDRLQGQAADPCPPEFTLPPSPAQEVPPSPDVRVVAAGGELFAFPSSLAGAGALPPSGMAPVALAPRALKGVAFAKGSVLPVLHLAERLGLSGRGEGRRLLPLELSGALFGFLVDEDAGALNDAESVVRPLPPVAATGWPRFVTLSRGRIIPLLDPWSLLGVTDREDLLRKLPSQYSPSSRFGELFERQNVEVVEFSLLGVRHALPKSEVEDVVGFRPYRKLPDAIPIVIGVAEHGGEVLPVLDLALVFGRRSLEKPDWSMLLVRNGDFRALVITERVYGERMLSRETQRRVPIHLPYDLVYGCYPEGVAVRLILNVEALSVHFDKSVVRDLLAALTTEMAAAPAELVYSLLPEEQLAAEAAAASFPEDVAGRESQPELEVELPLSGEAAAAQAQTGQRDQQDSEERAKAGEEEKLQRAREEELRRQTDEEQAIREAEELSRKAEEETRREAEEKTRREAEEEQARRQAEERAEQEAEEPERQQAAEKARREAEELAQQESEAKAKREAEEQAGKEADELRRIEEESRARQEAEDRARRETEEEARRLADEEKARREAEDRTRREAEEQKRIEEAAKRAAEEKARREAGERMRLEAAERAAREAEELAKQEAAEKARREAEAQARNEAEEKARLIAEEQARNEAEERKRLEEEERARKEAQERVQREAEELAKRQAEEHARREAEERLRRLAEEEAARKAEEERRKAAAAAILETERTRKEKERKLMQAAGITLADKPPSSPEAAPSAEEQSRLRERTGWKKYVAIAAGLILVTLIYFGAQVRSPEEKSGEGTNPGERVVRKNENTGTTVVQEPVRPETKVAQERVQSKTTVVREPSPPKEATPREEPLVLTVPPGRVIETDVYIVVKGDTLWAICRRFTGNPFNYPRVARDNRIANPDLIFPGQKIHLKK